MNETPAQTPEKTPVGNLTDFVSGVDANNHLDIEVAVKDDGRVVVFHNRPFKVDVSWFEFDLSESKLDFVMENGDIRNVGMTLNAGITKYMQNSHQILMVLMDDATGDAVQGNYIPLVIHRK